MTINSCIALLEAEQLGCSVVIPSKALFHSRVVAASIKKECLCLLTLIVYFP